MDRLGPDGTRASDTLRGVAVGLVEGVRELRLHAEAGRAIAVVGVHRIAFGVLTAGGLLLVRYTFNFVEDADTALNEFALLTGAAALGALVGAILTPGASRRWGSVRVVRRRARPGRHPRHRPGHRRRDGAVLPPPAGRQRSASASPGSR